jgi:hypothetical protein
MYCDGLGLALGKDRQDEAVVGNGDVEPVGTAVGAFEGE